MEGDLEAMYVYAAHLLERGVLRSRVLPGEGRVITAERLDCAASFLHEDLCLPVSVEGVTAVWKALLQRPFRNSTDLAEDLALYERTVRSMAGSRQTYSESTSELRLLAVRQLNYEQAVLDCKIRFAAGTCRPVVFQHCVKENLPAEPLRTIILRQGYANLARWKVADENTLEFFTTLFETDVWYLNIHRPPPLLQNRVLEKACEFLELGATLPIVMVCRRDYTRLRPAARETQEV